MNTRCSRMKKLYNRAQERLTKIYSEWHTFLNYWKTYQLCTFKSDFRDKWRHYLFNTKIKNEKQRHTDLSETDDITKERNGYQMTGVCGKVPVSMSLSSGEMWGGKWEQGELQLTTRAMGWGLKSHTHSKREYSLRHEHIPGPGI